MGKIKIDIRNLLLIKRRINKDEITIEELIDFTYDMIAENIRLKEKIEELEGIENL